MPARIGTACQTMGVASKQLELVFFRISKRAADDLVLNSLDPRVVDLTFILRVDGKFGTFEGEPVENVKFGRVRDYISVDFLIKEHEWRDRTVQQITDVLIARVERTPEVLAAACKDRYLICKGEFPVGPQSPERLRKWHPLLPNVPGLAHCFFCFPDGNTLGWAGQGWEPDRPDDTCSPYSADWDADCVKARLKSQCQDCDGGGGNGLRPPRFNPHCEYMYPFNDCNDACACMREAFVQAIQSCTQPSVEEQSNE